MSDYTADEMMTRRRRPGAARRHRPASSASGCPAWRPTWPGGCTSPDLCLIYESGTIGAKPTAPPLSIGDGELAETADAVVSVPEIFNYWLQPGRIEVGFLGAAQLDRFGNINTTVIGPRLRPTRGPAARRRRGAGDRGVLPARCSSCCGRAAGRSWSGSTSSPRSGTATGPGTGERLGLRGARPAQVITDLGVLEPDPATCELTLTAVHPGGRGRGARGTGWP